MTSFAAVAKGEFDFLKSEYGYEVVAETESSYGGSVTLANRSVGVGVRLEYDHRSAFIFIIICRLMNGELRENQLPIKEDSEICCFDFNDYLEAEQKMQSVFAYSEGCPFYDPLNGLRNYTKEFATRLRNYGDRLLRGDLSSLPRMEAMIKRRAQKFERDR